MKRLSVVVSAVFFVVVNGWICSAALAGACGGSCGTPCVNFGCTGNDPLGRQFHCQKNSSGGCNCTASQSWLVTLGAKCCKPGDKGGLQITSALTRIGLGSGPSFWAPGAQYSGGLESATTFIMDNEDLWGVSTNTAPAPSLGGMAFTLSADPDPDYRVITVNSFTAQIPSFQHPATAPAFTGLNVYTLDNTEYPSMGRVNIVTGQVDLAMSALLTNDYYPSNSPAKVLIDISGTVDPAQNSVVLLITGMAYQNQ